MKFGKMPHVWAAFGLDANVDPEEWHLAADALAGAFSGKTKVPSLDVGGVDVQRAIRYWGLGH